MKDLVDFINYELKYLKYRKRWLHLLHFLIFLCWTPGLIILDFHSRAYNTKTGCADAKKLSRGKYYFQITKILLLLNTFMLNTVFNQNMIAFHFWISTFFNSWILISAGYPLITSNQKQIVSRKKSVEQSWQMFLFADCFRFCD